MKNTLHEPGDRADLFDWQTNSVQETLQLLHDTESAHKQEIQEIVREMLDSHMFWRLMSRYTDVYREAKNRNDDDAMNAVEYAMLARFFVAGSLRKAPVIDEERVAC